MSDVKRRVTKLEGELAPGDGELCSCPDGTRFVYVDDWRDDRPDPGPEVCPKCGRPRLTIEFVYTENWREKGGEP